ncbi:MAG TPA: MBL fold metallo-hydrolase [Bacilli bacterium]|nr:MBL fold metallo-hydrolase [Bacilli bacterium]
MSHTYQMILDGEVPYLHGKINTFGKTFHYYVYYVDGLLIDTGPPRAKEAVATFVAKVKPDKVFITHYHEDHSGNAAFLHEQFGIPIYTNKKTANIIKKKLPLPLFRRLTWGKASSSPVVSLIADKEIQTKNHRFQVVATPGHSDDHTSLIDEEKRILFSGDLFLAKKLHYSMKEESIPQLIHSIEHILTCQFDTLYCAHAGIIPNGQEALLEKKQFLESLVKQTIKLYEQGHEVKQIAKMLLPSQKMLYLFSFGEIAPTHLIRSIILGAKK